MFVNYFGSLHKAQQFFENLDVRPQDRFYSCFKLQKGRLEGKFQKIMPIKRNI